MSVLVMPAKTHIRAWRNHRGLTLERLAARVGMTHASLSRIERGMQPYSQQILESLADALGCEPADLLVRDPSDPEGLWSIWDQLTPVQRKQVIEIARTIKRTG